jgi:hypothetical protein
MGYGQGRHVLGPGECQGKARARAVPEQGSAIAMAGQCRGRAWPEQGRHRAVKGMFRTVQGRVRSGLG